MAAMVAHKAATRRRIAWVAVTIARRRPLPQSFQAHVAAERPNNDVETKDNIAMVIYVRDAARPEDHKHEEDRNDETITQPLTQFDLVACTKQRFRCNSLRA
jgi:hypothetical protein